MYGIAVVHSPPGSQLPPEIPVGFEQLGRNLRLSAAGSGTTLLVGSRSPDHALDARSAASVSIETLLRLSTHRDAQGAAAGGSSGASQPHSGTSHATSHDASDAAAPVVDLSHSESIVPGETSVPIVRLLAVRAGDPLPAIGTL